MGLLGDILDVSMRHEERKRRKERDREENSKQLKNSLLAPKSKLKSALTSAVLIGFFLGIALLIVYIADLIGRTHEFGLIIAIVFIITTLLSLAIPWSVNIEKKQNVKLSIAFLCFVGVCAIFWIISAFLIYHIFRDIIAVESSVVPSKSLNFIRVSLFITLQFVIANLITSSMMRYKKNLIIFQSVMYASNLYVDFYLSFLIWCFTINEKGFDIVAGNLAFLKNGVVLTILVIAIVYVIVCKSILNRIQKKKGGLIGVVADSYGSIIDSQEEAKAAAKEEPKVQEAKPDEKLAKLKEMYEKELITKEEYDSKRSEIIDKL